MPHVSERKHDDKLFTRIYAELTKEILGKGNLRERNFLLNELLTSTEKIMLAKRFALIFMLGEGYTFEEIQFALNLSASTVARYWLEAKNGAFGQISKRARNKIKSKRVMESILELLYIPPKPIYAPRWKFLDSK